MYIIKVLNPELVTFDKSIQFISNDQTTNYFEWWILTHFIGHKSSVVARRHWLVRLHDCVLLRVCLYLYIISCCF